MKKLNVVISAGGTVEKIDQVRVVTNISTGKLGAKIANLFLSHGHTVTYVAPSSAVQPQGNDFNRIIVTNTQSVVEATRMLVPKADVVIHSMAVSDFTFNIEEATKLSSDSSDAFIEHISKTITKTPKVISYFRTWNPSAILVGFKFTVGKTPKELMEIAKKLMVNNNLDMVLANDKTQMQEAGAHVATLIMKDWTDRLRSKEEIAQGIYSNVVRLKGG